MGTIQLGVDTFGDVTLGPDGALQSQAQTIRDLIAQAELADRVGLDSFGVGEHHRDDFAVSSPETVLAAIAARTERIIVASAVTVLSSDDPVRVFQRFATVDAISGGRAEAVLGRGSFTESFPLFGYRLEDYETLFAEKLELFTRLIEEKPVSWSGRTRAALDEQNVYPRTETGLRTWVAVGGSPESVIRTAEHGLPMILAIIGGDPLRFEPFARLFRDAEAKFGGGRQPLAVHSPGHVAATDDQAKDELWPHYQRMHARIGRERGWGPLSRENFEAEAGPGGALHVGSPETVAAKILRTHRVLGNDRFQLKYANGTMPHEQLMSSLELYGREVAPIVRDTLAAG
ncbi:putative oxidoreductase protein [Mycetocola reblochoni REB411]|uniref:Putative oxidoreductase protein n=1 Tax=Mycetocola reblochoni REB411 TaxID=1255698 RepID=A0A1R4IHV0_9MICO|nr:LLM class flavin-dependent oxidoreductase [Mycetocola reblochoni]SJN19492.1 putative oxidoreductase protein [Mycetocola reblochoni REB411]